MGQQLTPQVVCCGEKGGSRNCEVGIWELSDRELSDHPDTPHSMVQMHGCTMDPPDFTDPDEWGCCRADHDEDGITGLTAMETLSYVPVRFEVSSTVDVDRSQARYQKIVVHSSRARTQRRSKAWEEWLRAATSGRSVTLLFGAGFHSPRDGAQAQALAGDCRKVKSTYFLDRGLTKMSIIPADPGSGTDETSPAPVTILVDNIQVVCPLTDFMLLSEAMEQQLTEEERSRAALVQYLTEDNVSKRVCFLEESENAKDRCIQALTALWLEKRNDHSMWF